MQADWLLPAAGTAIAFLILFSTFWGLFEMYETFSAGREALEVAEEISRTLVVVASAADEYSQAGFSEKIYLPKEIHNSPYRVVIDEEKFEARVELLGRHEGKVVGASRLPVFAVYHEGEKILGLKGFESGGGGVSWAISEKTRGLLITKSVKPKRTITIEATEDGIRGIF